MIKLIKKSVLFIFIFINFFAASCENDASYYPYDSVKTEAQAPKTSSTHKSSEATEASESMLTEKDDFAEDETPLSNHLDWLVEEEDLSESSSTASLVQKSQEMPFDTVVDTQNLANESLPIHLIDELQPSHVNPAALTSNEAENLSPTKPENKPITSPSSQKEDKNDKPIQKESSGFFATLYSTLKKVYDWFSYPIQSTFQWCFSSTDQTQENTDNEHSVTKVSLSETSSNNISKNEQPNLKSPTKPSPGQREVKKVKKMAIIGDSISAGYLIDTQKGATPEFSSPSFMGAKKLFLKQEPFSQLFSNLQKIYRNWEYSAFSDTKNSYSHAAKLGIDKDSIFNFSDTMTKPLIQAKKIPDDVDYVVVQLSYRDICSTSFDINEVEAQYETIIHELQNRARKPAILIIPPYDLSKIYNTHSGSDLAFSYSLFFRYSCSDMRDGKAFGKETALCPLLAQSTTLEEGLFKIQDNYENLLKAFKHKTKEWSQPSSGLFVYFASDISKISLTNEKTAVDCFHPNAKGHEELAKISWSTIQELFESN